MTALQATAGDNDESSIMNRRNALFGIMAATVGAIAVGSPEEASARYSAYAHREQDWEERQASGAITVKSARDLRAELKEMVPQNDSRSKIFCPNGPSAAVSPLMENKCGDRLALPSVYGRTQDVVGNSIPGRFSATKLYELIYEEKSSWRSSGCPLLRILCSGECVEGA